MPHAGIGGLARALQNGKVHPANGAELRMDTAAEGLYPFFPVKPVVRLLVVFFLAHLCAQAAERPPMAHAMMGVANGCFVESVAFLDTWQERLGGESWAKLLRWGAKEDDEVVAGHAVAVCEVRDKLWCYDINFGWAALAIDPGQRENVDAVAVPIVAKYTKITAQFPNYSSDFPQSPSESRPAAQPANQNAAVRDATIAGEKLAHHRPVNVVGFTWGPEEDKHESAVAVFLFGGRYCVYSPEKGTIPFRARGGIENLRLIRELLLRIFPGTSDMKKL